MKITSQDIIACIPNVDTLPDHHKAGPSSLGYIELCPSWKNRAGSVHPIAEEGTILHSILDGKDAPLDFDLTDNRRRVLEFCQMAVVGHPGRQPVVKEINEIKLPIYSPYDGSLLTFGTADKLIIREDGTAELFDYKFGFHWVESPDVNMQGVAYAIGVFQAFPMVHSVEISFIMARYEEVLGPQLLVREKLSDYMTRLLLILERREATEPLYFPNGKACMYCGNKVKCPAINAKALVLANKYKDTAEDFSLLRFTDATLEGFSSPERLGQLKKFVDVLDDLCEQAREHCRRMAIEEGVVADGYEVAEKRPPRAFSDKEKALELLFTTFPQLTPQLLLESIDLSPSDMENVVTVIAPPRQGAAYVRTLASAIAPVLSNADAEPIRYLRAKKKS
jgi:hypothetical protein